MPRVEVASGDDVVNACSARISSIQATGINEPRAIYSQSHIGNSPCIFFSKVRLTCTKALKVQMIVVRNAAGSIACAWLTNACYSTGNIFLGKPSHLQSRGELIVANSVWAAIAFCTVVFASHLPLLLSLRFLDAPDRPPSVWYCLKRLARATFIFFIAAIIAVLGFSYLAIYLSQVNPATLKYKIEGYADNLSLLIYFTGITREMKNIYYQETCQGRDKLKAKRRKSRKSFLSARVSSSVTPQSAESSLTIRRSPVFWKAYIKKLPSATPPILATAFVHILSRQRIVERGSFVLGLFFIGGVALKLTIQELAKLYVIKKRVRSTRMMCVLVGVPTVLIDTQARMILIGSSNIKTAVVGVLGMGLLEISFRLGKAKFLQWIISQREKALLRHNDGLSSAVPRGRPSLTSGHMEFETWRRQLKSFHAAELNADMYAEYIAIGCSASILFFFGNHPHYALLRQSYTTTELADLSTWRLNQLKMLTFQLGIEVVVDYISIVLEMATGLEFDHIKNLGSFLAVLFMVTAVMNITISIGIYLS